MDYPEERTGDGERDDTPMDKDSEGLSSTYVSSGDVRPPSVSRSVSNSNENLPESTKEEKIRNKDNTGGREKGAFMSRQSSVEEEEETFKERERRFLNENAPISTQRAQDKTKKLKMDEQSEEGEERKEHGGLDQIDFTKMMPRSSTQESEAVSTSDHVVTSPPAHTVLHSVRTPLFKNKQVFFQYKIRRKCSSLVSKRCMKIRKHSSVTKNYNHCNLREIVRKFCKVLRESFVRESTIFLKTCWFLIFSTV